MQPNKANALRWQWLLYVGAAAMAVMLPLLLIKLNVPFIRLMDDTYHPIALLQLFIFTASVMLSTVLVWKLWRHDGDALRAQLPLLLGILVSFHFLAIMRHHAARSWDYACYERAAQAIVVGQNPYGDCYIYFPTPAQALAALAMVGEWIAVHWGHTNLTGTMAPWDLVFYLYESTQLLLVMLAFFLCFRLATTLGITRLYASVLVAVLFLINNPLLATLKHNQVNLWVLNFILLAMLWLPRYPLISGLLVALGGHVKLYPLALLLPWALKRQWRALFSAGVGFVGIFLFQTSGGRDLLLWRQFLDFADSFPRGTFFRDNSLHSLVYNSLGHLKWLLHDGSFPVNELYVSRIVLVGMALLGILYLVRFVQREQNSGEKSSTVAASQLGITQLFIDSRPASTAFTTTIGHSFDAIALALIASPVVWEHHYLLAMPLFIGAVARARSERKLWLIGISAFSMFILPTFDVFPFSYHRIAGLLLLMYTLSPGQGWWTAPLTAGQRSEPQHQAQQNIAVESV